MVAILLIGGRSPGEAQSEPACVCRPEPIGAADEGHDPVVRLHVFNMASVSAAFLADAELEATDVYRAASVALVWSDGLAELDSGRVTASGSGVDLRVIVVGGEAERRLIVDGHLADTVLGFAPTIRGCFCGRNAYIFSERIMTIGYQHGNPESLLGRVLAHEVGHLLLSSNSHSRSGIMRATLATELSFQPRFTDNDAKALRRGLARLQVKQAVTDLRRAEARQ
jgi:hypothetical protein